MVFSEKFQSHFITDFRYGISYRAWLTVFHDFLSNCFIIITGKLRGKFVKRFHAIISFLLYSALAGACKNSIGETKRESNSRK
nr:MAG TPA: hypothetical protein [Caudoviricetes sp.]